MNEEKDKNNWVSKIKRNLSALFLNVDENRIGKCFDCGKCCELPIPCPFLTYNNGKSRCEIYELRPPSCRKYPRTKKEHITENLGCGYRWNDLPSQQRID